MHPNPCIDPSLDQHRSVLIGSQSFHEGLELAILDLCMDLRSEVLALDLGTSNWNHGKNRESLGFGLIVCSRACSTSQRLPLKPRLVPSYSLPPQTNPTHTRHKTALGLRGRSRLLRQRPEATTLWIEFPRQQVSKWDIWSPQSAPYGGCLGTRMARRPSSIWSQKCEHGSSIAIVPSSFCPLQQTRYLFQQAFLALHMIQ